jgi:hypothetical protein
MLENQNQVESWVSLRGASCDALDRSEDGFGGSGDLANSSLAFINAWSHHVCVSG